MTEQYDRMQSIRDMWEMGEYEPEDFGFLLAEIERQQSKIAQVVAVVYALAPLDLLLRVKDIVDE